MKAMVVAISLLAMMTWPVFSQGSEPTTKAAEYWTRKASACPDGMRYQRYQEGFIQALRGFNFRVIPDPVSEADGLNGVEWAGRTLATATSYRRWTAQSGWQDWQSMPAGIGAVRMLKKKGAWTY